METIKKCPHCGEEIAVTAKKCKHCKEWLEQETNAVELSGAIEPESQGGMLALMSGLCYVAMLFAISTCFQDLDIDIEKPKNIGVILLWLLNLIPEWLNYLASGVLWVTLFWTLGNYFLKRGLQLLAILEGFLCLLSILLLGDDTFLADTTLSVLCIVGLAAYLIVMFIVGIKIKAEYGWIFLVYAISSIIFWSLPLIISLDGDGNPWWRTVIDCILDVFMLYILKLQFGALDKSSEAVSE